MPITKGNRAIAARVRVTIVAPAARVPEGAAARPRLGAMVTVAVPAHRETVRPGIAPVARAPVEEIARKVAATAARVRRIAVLVIVRMRARRVKHRVPRLRN